jgi:hypothetical protein
MRALLLSSLLLCVILSSVSAALCPTGCKSCDYLIKCNACEKGYVLYDYQCGQCASGCDKCKVTQTSGSQYWTQCTGSCQGGCDQCSNGDTCTRCRSGYVLKEGVCYACNGCSQCNFVQVTSSTYRTECVSSVNPDNVINGLSGNPMPFIIVGALLLVGGVICFLKKQKDQKERDLIQRDYMQAMAAEKQRQVVVSPVQYQPPQGYQQQPRY